MAFMGHCLGHIARVSSSQNASASSTQKQLPQQGPLLRRASGHRCCHRVCCFTTDTAQRPHKHIPRLTENLVPPPPPSSPSLPMDAGPSTSTDAPYNGSSIDAHGSV